MRLYLDENLSSKELASRLTSAGHILVPTLLGDADEFVWTHAHAEAAVLVTFNGRDFEPLASGTVGHHGLLVIHRENDPGRDMTPAAIAAAIDRVAAAMPEGVAGQTFSLNAFR